MIFIVFHKVEHKLKPYFNFFYFKIFKNIHLSDFLRETAIILRNIFISDYKLKFSFSNTHTFFVDSLRI
jgi:hypothetical protein